MRQNIQEIRNYEYIEFISKNNQHRFKDINSANKTVKVYTQPNSDWCIVKTLLDFTCGHATGKSARWWCKALVLWKCSRSKYTKKVCSIYVHTGVPEEIISDISGHKSLKALHAYERTSTEQQKTAGESIYSGKFFNGSWKELWELLLLWSNVLLLSLNLLLLTRKEF